MAVIWYVDDDEDHLNKYSQDLEELGHEVRKFTSGRCMLSELETVRPDLVILDIRMPDMDGFEVLGKVLANDNTIPVIFHTAYASYENNYLVWSAEAYAIKQVSKGGEPSELVKVVEGSLAKQGRKGS